MDSFKYDRETGLSMFVPQSQPNELVQSFGDEDDDRNVKGDNDELEG